MLKIIIGSVLVLFGCIFGLDVDNSVDNKDITLASGVVYLAVAIIIIFIGAFILGDGINSIPGADMSKLQ